MNKTGISKFVLDKTAKYKLPCVITLSGPPGSGKTTCAKVLSKKLKIFIVSNDFIRQQYKNNNKELHNQSQKILNRKVLLLNLKRLLKLFSYKVSVILDSDVSDYKRMKQIELLTKIFNYQIIKIKINSYDDQKNINRIKERIKTDEVFDLEIIGDNTPSSYFDIEKYYIVKSRVMQSLDNNIFDYVLDNDSDLNEYLKNLNEIIQDVKKKLVINGRNK